MSYPSVGISRVRLHFAQNRIRWSRGILLATLVSTMFMAPPKYVNAWILDVLELGGYAMLAVATLLRVWCLTFIGGTKDGQLAVAGPYSVVRNPLYLASFVGVVGFGLAVELPLLAIVLAVSFGVLYPAVVAQEEVRLTELFGAAYTSYCETVPRWVPRWSAYQEPKHVLVATEKVRQGIVDAMWYLWAFALAELIEILREHAVLPLLS